MLLLFFIWHLSVLFSTFVKSIQIQANEFSHTHLPPQKRCNIIIMIVYQGTKKQFVLDVRDNSIADKIKDAIILRGLNAGQDKEYISWQNSMQFMRNIVDDTDIDDEVDIAIEYNIPLTSKRVDFIISGADSCGIDNVVIVELKQWQKAEVVDDDMHYSVRSFVANRERILCHPSYQAFSYSQFIKNYAQTVIDNNINIVPCAYLHNYQPEYKHSLNNEIYKEWYTEAPFFIKNEVSEFTDFIKSFVCKRSSNGDILYQLDHGRLRPTKALQDSLVSMIKGNDEFILLDEQAVCFDICIKAMLLCKKDGKKRTIIIQGGPGTGKSVLAINLLMEFIKMHCNTSYVTKNSAPRNVFLKLLTKSDAKKLVDIKQLFRSPFALSKCPSDTYDCLIVDEAHRLVKKMYGDWNGENQVKECIEASLLTIFMIDEDQKITSKDIGSIEEIKKWCLALNSEIIMTDETKLVSQFRCNGSDSYIQFINNILQIGPQESDASISDLNFDFKIFDSPIEFRNSLREINKINNKARMVAGYCYDWDVKHHRAEYDIELRDGFRAKWNLENDNIWAINPKSFEEIGCIHTAQGLEFDYVGVIIGKDLKYNPTTQLIETDKNAISKDDNSSGIRSACDEIAHKLIINTYKTLLTRGQKGCYIYCEDDNLREYIRAKCKF